MEIVQETAQKMMETTIPKEHQALGRKAKGFDRKKWDERKPSSESPKGMRDVTLTIFVDKSRIVEEGNYHKFTKSKNKEQMLKMLLDTGDRELVEVKNHNIKIGA